MITPSKQSLKKRIILINLGKITEETDE